MARHQHHCPFTTDVFDQAHHALDVWPASYHDYETSGETVGRRKRRVVADPIKDVKKFLKADLSVNSLNSMLKHLWLAGSRRPPAQLHSQVALGRQIIVAERMDYHLVWDNGGKIFLRPIPAFLLDLNVWQNNLACPPDCGCQGNRATRSQSCMRDCCEIARGFLSTYRALVASETDFIIANEHRLLPRGPNGDEITWQKWKTVVRELVASYHEGRIHPRFQRGELRLSRLNMIHRFTRVPLFNPYIRSWRNYGSLFRGNLTWMASATVFIALVLTAMQVGLATDRLKDNAAFQQASYGFTVFAILGPIGVFSLILLAAAYNLVEDLPWALGNRVREGSESQTGHV